MSQSRASTIRFPQSSVGVGEVKDRRGVLKIVLQRNQLVGTFVEQPTQNASNSSPCLLGTSFEQPRSARQSYHQSNCPTMMRLSTILVLLAASLPLVAGDKGTCCVFANCGGCLEGLVSQTQCFNQGYASFDPFGLFQKCVSNPATGGDPHFKTWTGHKYVSANVARG